MKTITNSEWFDGLFQQTIGNFDILHDDILYVNHIRLATEANGYISVESPFIIATQDDNNDNFGVLNSALADGAYNSVSVGKENTSSNALRIKYNHVGNGSSSNNFTIGFYGGGNTFTIPYSGASTFSGSLQTSVTHSSSYLTADFNIATNLETLVNTDWATEFSTGSSLLGYLSGQWYNSLGRTIIVTVSYMTKIFGSTAVTRCAIQRVHPIPSSAAEIYMYGMQIVGAEDWCAGAATFPLADGDSIGLIIYGSAGSSLHADGNTLPDLSVTRFSYTIHT
jgi:hypothetical protein